MSMESYKAARKCVKKGARLLDEKEPGWFNEGRIDLDKLDMSSLEDCVVGQLNEGRFTNLYSYEGGVRRYGVETNAFEYGFESGGDECLRYADLTAAWKRKIIKRRKKAALVVAS